MLLVTSFLPFLVGKKEIEKEEILNIFVLVSTSHYIYERCTPARIDILLVDSEHEA